MRTPGFAAALSLPDAAAPPRAAAVCLCRPNGSGAAAATALRLSDSRRAADGAGSADSDASSCSAGMTLWLEVDESVRHDWSPSSSGDSAITGGVPEVAVPECIARTLECMSTDASHGGGGVGAARRCAKLSMEDIGDRAIADRFLDGDSSGVGLPLKFRFLDGESSGVGLPLKFRFLDGDNSGVGLPLRSPSGCRGAGDGRGGAGVASGAGPGAPAVSPACLRVAAGGSGGRVRSLVECVCDHRAGGSVAA